MKGLHDFGGLILKGIRNVKELVVPEPEPAEPKKETFEDYINAVKNLISHPAEGGEFDLSEYLNLICQSLIEELQSADKKKYNFMLQSRLPELLCSVLTSTFRPAYSRSILEFYLHFICPPLNCYFEEKQINTYFSLLLVQLSIIYFSIPKDVHLFLKQIWEIICEKPTYLDLLSISGNEPLLDFFIGSAFIFDPIGELSRDILKGLLVSHRTQFNIEHIKYLKQNLFPKVVLFSKTLKKSSRMLTTNGSIYEICKWINTFMSIAEFPVDSFYPDSNMTPENIYYISFAFTAFTETRLISIALHIATSTQFLQMLNKNFNMDNDLFQPGLNIISELFNTGSCVRHLLPSEKGEKAELVIPEQYIDNDYKKPPIFDGERQCPFNLFRNLVNAIPNISKLDADTLKKYVQVMCSFLERAPDLADNDFVTAIQSQIQEFSEKLTDYQQAIIKIAQAAL